jgi:hypothetical protein
MKKTIPLLAITLLVACGSAKKEIIEDPICQKNKILFHEDGKASYLIQDPIFSENKILFGHKGKKAYLVADPLFEGNYLIFPQPK